MADYLGTGAPPLWKGQVLIPPFASGISNWSKPFIRTANRSKDGRFEKPNPLRSPLPGDLFQKTEKFIESIKKI
jgi:hypothetical protein